jgi:nuclear pore complex protein Nup98-Nup96
MWGQTSGSWGGGAPATQPAVAFGGFGIPQQQPLGGGQPAFGATQPAFGATQPAFGATQPAFGANQAAPAFGFGASQAFGALGGAQPFALGAAATGVSAASSAAANIFGTGLGTGGFPSSGFSFGTTGAFGGTAAAAGFGSFGSSSSATQAAAAPAAKAAPIPGAPFLRCHSPPPRSHPAAVDVEKKHIVRCARAVCCVPPHSFCSAIDWS